MFVSFLRKRSFFQPTTEEAERVLTLLGAEVRVFNPTGLPLVDESLDAHEKVQELRDVY